MAMQGLEFQPWDARSFCRWVGGVVSAVYLRTSIPFHWSYSGCSGL